MAGTSPINWVPIDGEKREHIKQVYTMHLTASRSLRFQNFARMTANDDRSYGINNTENLYYND